MIPQEIWGLEITPDGKRVYVKGAFDFYVELDGTEDMQRVGFYLEKLLKLLNKNWTYKHELKIAKEYGEFSYKTKIQAIEKLENVQKIVNMTTKTLVYENHAGNIIELQWNTILKQWE